MSVADIKITVGMAGVNVQNGTIHVHPTYGGEVTVTDNRSFAVINLGRVKVFITQEQLAAVVEHGANALQDAAEAAAEAAALELAADKDRMEAGNPV